MNKENNNPPSTDDWTIDFFDDFETFNTENWQDQRIWVNNELQCYVPNGEYGTREVSDGTLKLKVLNIGDKIECDICGSKFLSNNNLLRHQKRRICKAKKEDMKI